MVGKKEKAKLVQTVNFMLGTYFYMNHHQLLRYAAAAAFEKEYSYSKRAF